MRKTTHVRHADALLRVSLEAGHHDVVVDGLWHKLVSLQTTTVRDEVHDVMSAANVVVPSKQNQAAGETHANGRENSISVR